MQTYVTLLYSIGLGEGRRLVMSDLRAMAEDLGLKNARTLIATGNLVFEARAYKISSLEQRLETAFEKTFGRHVDIIVRGAKDWLKLAAGNPFADQSVDAGDQVAVRVMREPVPRTLPRRCRPMPPQMRRCSMSAATSGWSFRASDQARGCLRRPTTSVSA